MSEEMQQKITQYLDAIANKVGSASDLAESKLPVLAQEWINSYFYGGLILLVVGLILSAIAVWSFRYREDKHGYDNVPAIFICCVCGIFGTVASISGSIMLFNIIVSPNAVVLYEITNTLGRLK